MDAGIWMLMNECMEHKQHRFLSVGDRPLVNRDSLVSLHAVVESMGRSALLVSSETDE